MSYCVNCGVELDKTCKACPLCNVPVVNPIQPVDTLSLAPYPKEKGQVSPAIHSDLAILLSVVYSATAIVCGVLNLFVFGGSVWSFYIIGICILLWIFSVPAFIYTKLPIYLSILLDGMAVAFYIGLIAYSFPGDGWYFNIALPIVVTITAFTNFFAFFNRRNNSSILSQAVLVFAGIGLVSVEIEILIHRYFDSKIYLTWAAVVLTCCAIIVVALLTIIKRSRLREEVRRRMHI